MKYVLNCLVLSLSMSGLLSSCKAVRSGKHSNESVGNSPIVETSSNQNPAKPGPVETPMVPVTQTVTPVVPTVNPATPNVVVPEGLGGRIVNIPEPTLPDPIPALTKPESLQVFALRSIPIEQNGLIPRQYRVDLQSRNVSLDELETDRWKEKTQYKLSDDQLQKIKTIVQGLKVGSYPSCNPCKREVQMILMEGLENNKKALSYAMSEPCTCGGNDERKATLSFADLKQITEILNK
jgi:hypothetical protein